ncbi:hypothetical protein Sjap_001491 [Stephania japonica]|uniref:Nodulation signaling pathway 2-like protein n=1 Tax=Stephania japonica TaxID=461633 RepID=A0AAP0KK29_9MAGN
MMQSHQSELLYYTPYYKNNIKTCSSFDEACDLNGLDMDVYMGDCDFSSSITTSDNSSDGTSMFYLPNMNDNTPDFFFPSPIFIPNDFPFEFPLAEEPLPFVEELEHFPNDQCMMTDEVENALEWMENNEIDDFLSKASDEEEFEGSLKVSTVSTEASPDIISSTPYSSLILPCEGMDIENQLIIPHLLKAYGDATENGQPELADTILRCLKEKVGPIGVLVERLGYYFLQAMDNQGDYLRQESSKNYEAAFMAFYQIFPYGRFAHLTSNSAIIEAMPRDAVAIHIIDFDMGEGVQWPPLMEAIGSGQEVRLTALKWKDDCQCAAPWRFEETKRRLLDHSRFCGLTLKVEEMEMEEIVNELTKSKTNSSSSREWLVFNCMVGLPHMGRGRSRMQVREFLRVAKKLLMIDNSCTRGIITFGDGDVDERVENCSGFGSFFDGHLKHFNALFESMDWHFPSQLREARIAMEHLFVAPYVSSLACFGKWEETREDGLQGAHGLNGWRFGKDNLVQAKEMVREGESPYRVTVQGEDQNVMALEWKSTALVKVSTWK